MTDESTELILNSSGEFPADYDEYIERLKGESDRGCVLVVAADIDNAVSELLRAYWVNNAQLSDMLLRPTGPLGNAAVKLQVAYMSGLINEKTFRTASKVIKIRNECAHKIAVDLDSQPIIDWVREMEPASLSILGSTLPKLVKGRIAFVIGSMTVARNIRVVAINTQRMEPGRFYAKNDKRITMCESSVHFDFEE
ncbi:MAG: hypothetical protein GC162_11625 [Planctomycetes bacterium]|nr:hypothetical protein [Planctomycetota bacterium]